MPQGAAVWRRYSFSETAAAVKSASTGVVLTPTTDKPLTDDGTFDAVQSHLVK